MLPCCLDILQNKLNPPRRPTLFFFSNDLLPSHLSLDLSNVVPLEGFQRGCCAHFQTSP